MCSGTCSFRDITSSIWVVPTTLTEPWLVAARNDCPVPVSAAR